jgi:hypothetical protein
MQDDFFDLGGNSLVAVQLIAQVRKEFGVKVPMQTLFEGATVARMAARVAQLRGAEPAGSTSGPPPAEPPTGAPAEPRTGPPTGAPAAPSGEPPAPTIRRLPRNL